MNKYLVTIALLLVAQPALAHYPIVTIDSIGGVEVGPGGPVISIPSFPWTIDFVGRVIHEGKGNLNRVEISATVDGLFIYGPESLAGSGNDSTHHYSIPWEVLRPGVYQVAIFANHSEPGQSSGPCKAAPAIANHYLKTNELDREAGTLKAVAQETGKKGTLWAKDKCAPDYELRTIEIVLGD